MYNNNIRTDSEIHKFINSKFRNYRLRLEWPLRGNYPAKFPRPKFPQEILARILPAEEILKPKISW